MADPTSYLVGERGPEPWRIRAEQQPDMLTHYSRALDAIYQQRQAAAIEAETVATLLRYSTLPKGVRTALDDMRGRLIATARGENAYAEMPTDLRKAAQAAAGAPTTLTRSGWEEAA